MMVRNRLLRRPRDRSEGLCATNPVLAVAMTPTRQKLRARRATYGVIWAVQSHSKKYSDIQNLQLRL
jgi:hypothetical protein